MTVTSPYEKRFSPIVYLHVFEGDGSDVWEQCEKLNAPPMTLVAIGGFELG